MTKSAIRVFWDLLVVGLAAHAGGASRSAAPVAPTFFVDNTERLRSPPASRDASMTMRHRHQSPAGTYLVDTPILVRRSSLDDRHRGLGGNIKNCQQLGNASCAAFVASTARRPASTTRENVHTVQTATARLLQAKNVKRVIFDQPDHRRIAPARSTEAQKKCLDRVLRTTTASDSTAR